MSYCHSFTINSIVLVTFLSLCMFTKIYIIISLAFLSKAISDPVQKKSDTSCHFQNKFINVFPQTYKVLKTVCEGIKKWVRLGTLNAVSSHFSSLVFNEVHERPKSGYTKETLAFVSTYLTNQKLE